MEDVKPQVKEAVKEFTKDYVSEVVKESTKKLIKALEKEKRAALEAEIKNRSAEEIERCYDANAEFNKALESTVDSIKEGSLEKIQLSFEEQFSDFPLPSPSLIGRSVNWIKQPIHAGIISVILISVVVALISNAPPESLTAITNGPYSGNINIAITFAGSASGGTPPYSHSWNFGDGASSNLQNPTHAYSRAGTYTATLTVTDSAGRIAESAAQVTVGVSQLIAVANGPYSGTVSITFAGSASGGIPPYSYSWNFGDGLSSNLQNPTHVYSGGTYTAILTVTDSAGGTTQSTAQVTVGVSQLIAIANGPYSGTVNAIIFFAGSALGGTPPYTYRWNFGDGGSSYLQNPTHIYSNAGNYNATLTVTDSAGGTAQSTAQVTIGVSQLTAIANGPYSGTVNAIIFFAGSALGGTPPYTYRWNFGDGGSSYLQTPAYSYSNAGNYNATLTVADSVGGTARSTAQVTVVHGKTVTWDAYNFAGFYYDLKENLGSESLQILQTNLAANQRTIYTDNLIYTTTGHPKPLKVLENGKTSISNTNGLNNFDTMSSAFGNYLIVGWQGQPYVGIKNLPYKLAKLIIEQGNASSDKKTLTVGETWDIGGGWTLTANSIDAKASPRQVWITLNKDGVKKEDRVVQQGRVYTYVEKSIRGESNVPLFVTYVDSIFAGATSDVLQLRYTWAIDTSITEIKLGDTYGVFKVTSKEPITLQNTDSSVTLSKDTTVNLMGGLDFKVANSDVLRFMPVVVTVFTQSGAYETRGTIWNEFPIAGSIGGTGKTVTWDAYNFAGFYYDLDDNLGSESLQILQTNLAANQRTIDTDNLIYTTMGQPKALKVLENGKTSISNTNGLNNFDTMSSAFGNYLIVGWQGQPYVGIKNLPYKLAKLIIEQGSATSEKKTLTIGDSWDVGGGWTLTANSIDAKASPRKAWITLSKDGVKKDDKIVTQGSVYTYVEPSIKGELYVPLFVTYVDSIFAGATSDVLQLRYTWAIDTSITEIKGGDIYGVFKVTSKEPITLQNTDSSVTLSKDTTINLMGGLDFKVADSDVLRFMPVVVTVFTQPGAYETRGAIWNEFPIAGSS